MYCSFARSCTCTLVNTLTIISLFLNYLIFLRIDYIKCEQSCPYTTFLKVVEKKRESRESSDSQSSKIDDLEETLERKLSVKSGASHVMKCVGGILNFE